MSIKTVADYLHEIEIAKERIAKIEKNIEAFREQAQERRREELLRYAEETGVPAVSAEEDDYDPGIPINLDWQLHEAKIDYALARLDWLEARRAFKL